MRHGHSAEMEGSGPSAVIGFTGFRQSSMPPLFVSRAGPVGPPLGGCAVREELKKHIMNGGSLCVCASPFVPACGALFMQRWGCFPVNQARLWCTSPSPQDQW